MGAERAQLTYPRFSVKRAELRFVPLPFFPLLPSPSPSGTPLPLSASAKQPPTCESPKETTALEHASAKKRNAAVTGRARSVVIQ
jgi:hypothetical protein